MKKYFVLLILVVFGLSFTLCNKEEQAGQISLNNEISNKTRSNEASGCDELVSFNVEKISDEDPCCIYEITIEILDPNSTRLEIRLDGDYLFSAFGTAITSHTITICDDQPHIISVMGTPESGGLFSEECESITVNCGCACDRKPYSITNLGENNEGCCEYNILASGVFGDCEAILNIGETIYNIGQISINRNVVVCPGDELIVSFTNGGILCSTDILSCGCYGDVESSVTNLGDTDDDGCCEWDLSIQNDTNCTKYLFDGKGVQVATILPGESYQFIFSNCLDFDWVGQWKLYNVDNKLCEEYDMSPKNCK
jgi:hypothetical protein